MEINIKLGGKCNLNCKYCNDPSSVETIDNELVISRLESEIPWVIDKFKNPILSFSGGEPGLWSEAIWNSIEEIVYESGLINKLDSVKIYTNGKLFSHPNFRYINKYKTKYIYHVTDNYLIRQNEQIYPLIVVTKSDLSKIQTMLDTIPTTNKIYVDPVQMSKFVSNTVYNKLDLNDYRIVRDTLYKNKSKVQESSLLLINYIVRSLEKVDYKYPIDKCYNQHKSILIDFVENRVYKCSNFENSEEYSRDLIMNRKVFKKEVNPYKCLDTCRNYLAFYSECVNTSADCGCGGK